MGMIDENKSLINSQTNQIMTQKSKDKLEEAFESYNNCVRDEINQLAFIKKAGFKVNLQENNDSVNNLLKDMTEELKLVNDMTTDKIIVSISKNKEMIDENKGLINSQTNQIMTQMTKNKEEANAYGLDLSENTKNNT